MVLKSLIGIVAGAAVGFLFYRLIGCSAGTCPITGNPYASTIYGALLGFLIASV